MERRLWSEEEDSTLRAIVRKEGAMRWSHIAKLMESKFFDFDRNGKQCRERWFNHLEDSLQKEGWSVYDQLHFIQLHSVYGNRWSEISKLMPGRAENSVKNYFYSSLRRAVRIINKYLEDNSTAQINLKFSFFNKVISIINQNATPLAQQAKSLIQHILTMTIRRPKSEPQATDQKQLLSKIIVLCRQLKDELRESSKQEGSRSFQLHDLERLPEGRHAILVTLVEHGY